MRFLKQIVQRPANSNRKTDQGSENVDLCVSANINSPPQYLRDRLEIYKQNYLVEVCKAFRYSFSFMEKPDWKVCNAHRRSSVRNSSDARKATTLDAHYAFLGRFKGAYEKVLYYMHFISLFLAGTQFFREKRISF